MRDDRSQPFSKTIARAIAAAIVGLDMLLVDGYRYKALELLRDNVLKPETTATWVANRIGSGSTSFFNEFKSVFDVTLPGYIVRVRVETADVAVACSRLDDDEIARMCGFKSRAVLAQAYLDVMKRSLEEARAEYRAGFDHKTEGILERIFEGQLSPGGYVLLQETLTEIYQRYESTTPKIANTPALLIPAPELPPIHIDEQRLVRAELRKEWEKIADWSFPHQEAHVRRCVLTSTAFYDFLHERARKEGRRDRHRGVDLQALAVASLETCEDGLGNDYPASQAIGVAWLGNQQRLALDFPSAAANLEKASRILKENPHLHGSEAEGTVHLIHGTLFAYGRNFPRAQRELNHALDVFRRRGDVLMQAKVLNQRAVAFAYEGRLAPALDDLERALHLLDSKDMGSDGRDLRDVVLLNMAAYRSQLGRTREARKTLDLLRPYRGRLAEDRSLQLLADWVAANTEDGEGHDDEAEAAYRRTIAGYGEAGERLSAAEVRLDLALLLLRRGRPEEAVAEAEASLPVFRAFELGRETRDCLRVLAGALAQEARREAALQALRDALRRDPLVELACPRDTLLRR